MDSSPAGVSADGQHGFTIGYIALTGTDGIARLGKYLAYWVRSAGGWQVAAYMRLARPDGEVRYDLMEPLLPDRIAPLDPDPESLDRYRGSLIRAEQAFSDEAQRIGLSPAFIRNGRDDAIHLGSGPSLVVGPADIARMVGSETPPSPVNWKADEALVASSGALGITFGMIRTQLLTPGRTSGRNPLLHHLAPRFATG